MDNNYVSVFYQNGFIVTRKPETVTGKWLRFFLTTGVYVIMLVVSVLLAIRFG